MVVADLAPGDQLQGYDYRNRKVGMATIVAVNSVESIQHVLLPIERYKMIPFTKQTIGLTTTGEKSLIETRQYIGYCPENPNKLIERNFNPAVDQQKLTEFKGITQNAVELQWECPDYIWFEGILVGTELK
jgi:hypothetical protein